MTFIVAIVLGVFAIVLGFPAADEVCAGVLGGLQLFPEFGAPADDFCDGIAEGHVPEGGICLGGGEGEEGG